MPSAVPRPGWTPGGGTDDMAAWLTQQVRQNPNYPLPAGYRLGPNGVERIQPNWMLRNPWIFPAMGIGAGALGASLAGGAAGGAGSVPTTVGIPGGSLPGVGASSGPVAAAGSGGATAASTGGALSRAMRLLGGAAPIVGALTQRNAGGSLGSNINELLTALPQVRDMMDLQVRQAQRADPLHQSLVTLSERLLPNSAR